MMGYPRGKNFEDMCNRLDRIPACDGQTDRHTDILQRHSARYAYASRSKNDIVKASIKSCQMSVSARIHRCLCVVFSHTKKTRT